MIDAYDVLGLQLDCKEEDVKKAQLEGKKNGETSAARINMICSWFICQKLGGEDLKIYSFQDFL